MIGWLCWQNGGVSEELERAELQICVPYLLAGKEGMFTTGLGKSFTLSHRHAARLFSNILMISLSDWLYCSQGPLFLTWIRNSRLPQIINSGLPQSGKSQGNSNLSESGKSQGILFVVPINMYFNKSKFENSSIFWKEYLCFLLQYMPFCQRTLLDLLLRHKRGKTSCCLVYW